MRLVGAPTPSIRGGRKQAEVGRIPAPSNRTGADLLLPGCNSFLRRKAHGCLTIEYVSQATLSVRPPLVRRARRWGSPPPRSVAEWWGGVRGGGRTRA